MYMNWLIPHNKKVPHTQNRYAALFKNELLTYLRKKVIQNLFTS